MNGGAHSERNDGPSVPYFPFHRDETYPRTLCVNFKRLEFRTLQKYCKLHGINIRPDCTQLELAVAAARHFQAAPPVDEEGVMTSFLKQVVVPDRPFRPSIDLTMATMGNSTNGAGRRGAMSIATSTNSSAGEDNHGISSSGPAGESELGERRGGGGERGGDGHPGHVYPSPSMMGMPGAGYKESVRPDSYSPHQNQQHRGGMMAGMRGENMDGNRSGGGAAGTGAGGGGSGVGYDHHEYDYGSRQGSQQQSSGPWEAEGHGGDVISKAKRSVGRNRFNRNSGSINSAHGGGSSMSDRVASMAGGGGSESGRGGGGSSGGGGAGGGGAEESKGRKHKLDRSGGNSGSGGGGGGGAGDGAVKNAPPKKRKGGGGWRGEGPKMKKRKKKKKPLVIPADANAKNGEQVAVLDDREEPGTWILARVIKYVTETHHYELKDDDDKEGLGGLTAPRSSVIRLEDSTKGVQRGDKVLAVFPDTTSFYLGVVHRVPKAPAGAEKRIEVKFQDDEDSTGRTPARAMTARYVVPVPEGFDEDMSKIEDEEAESGEGITDANGNSVNGGGTGGGGGNGGSAAGHGGNGNGGEEEYDEPMDEEDDGEPSYVDMIRAALMKLPGRQGNHPAICNYIEEHFHDRLDWKSEPNIRRTPAWKSSVRRTLARHASFCHAGTPERNVYTLTE